MLPAAGGVAAMARDTEKGLRLLMALSGLVLLIACANIANLLLARGAARKLQTSVRLALGARRGRLVQAIADRECHAGSPGRDCRTGCRVPWYAQHSRDRVPRFGVHSDQPEPSTPVMLFSFGLSLADGSRVRRCASMDRLACRPGRSAARRQPLDHARRHLSAKDCWSWCRPHCRWCWWRARCLMVQSLRKLEHQNFGFQSDHRYIVRVSRAFVGYPPEQRAAAYRELRQKMNSIPGVITSSYSLYSPMEGEQLEYVRLCSRPRAQLRRQWRLLLVAAHRSRLFRDHWNPAAAGTNHRRTGHANIDQGRRRQRAIRQEVLQRRRSHRQAFRRADPNIPSTSKSLAW